MASFGPSYGTLGAFPTKSTQGAPGQPVDLVEEPEQGLEYPWRRNGADLSAQRMADGA